MTEWQVVGVIVVLVGFTASIVTPIAKLTAKIAELCTALKTANNDLAELTSRNKEAHGRIFNKLDDHEAALADHDKRIFVLETKEETKSGR